MYPFYHNFLFAAGSGFLASIITQPLDYFKTVIQSNKNKTLNLSDIYYDSLSSQKKQLFNMKYLVFFNGVWSRSSISFLGMGIQPPTPSWGGIMLDGKKFITSSWWLTTLPGLAIVLTSLSLILIGEGLQKRSLLMRSRESDT